MDALRSASISQAQCELSMVDADKTLVVDDGSSVSFFDIDDLAPFSTRACHGSANKTASGCCYTGGMYEEAHRADNEV